MSAKRAEPVWVPHPYLPIKETQCAFIDSQANVVTCTDDDFLSNYMVLPLSDLEGLRDKIQRCQQW